MRGIVNSGDGRIIRGTIIGDKPAMRGHIAMGSGEKQSMRGHVSTIVRVNIEDGGCDLEEYKGAYEVTPQVTGQTLSTANKVMRNDVKIKEIPFFEVSNNGGGNTVYIGSEV